MITEKGWRQHHIAITTLCVMKNLTFFKVTLLLVQQVLISKDTKLVTVSKSYKISLPSHLLYKRGTTLDNMPFIFVDGPPFGTQMLGTSRDT